MDSPRPSEAETFVDNTMFADHPANARLMEEFTIDPNPLKGATSNPIPPLFTPAYTRAYNLINAARIAIFILNLLAGFILAFGDDFDSALLPITIFTSFICFIPTLLPMILYIAAKPNATKKAELRDQVGTKRNAVLVEDPVTGEERWMLEPKKKNIEDAMGRVGFVVFDICCGSLLMISIALSVVFGGDESAKTMGWLVAARVLILLLVAASGCATFMLMGTKAKTDDGLERNDYE